MARVMIRTGRRMPRMTMTDTDSENRAINGPPIRAKALPQARRRSAASIRSA